MTYVVTIQTSATDAETQIEAFTTETLVQVVAYHEGTALRFMVIHSTA